MDVRHQDYVVSDDPARLDLDAIHAFLSRSYWARDIPRETVARSLANSLCIGAYAADGRQVGLARFVTDRATFCYVCDVYVLEEHRGRGLSAAMMRAAADHPDLQGLRRWNLVTKDAHGLYAKFGFVPATHPEHSMERRDPGIYQRLRGSSSQGV